MAALSAILRSFVKSSQWRLSALEKAKAILGDHPGAATGNAVEHRANEADIHPHRAWLATWSEPYFAADMSVLAILQRVRDSGAAKIRCDQGWMAGDKAANALPPVGRAWV